MRSKGNVLKWARGGGLLLVIALFAYLAMIAPAGLRAEAAAVQSNVVANGGFESGIQSWTCKACTLSAGAPARDGLAAGQLRTTRSDRRAQLFQNGLSLQPGVQYELSFWAKSSGPDLQVDLVRQVSPFTNYGLNKTFNITGEWQEFKTTFTTKGFSSPVTNGRLRFRTPRGSGITYSIDNISLSPLGAPPPPTSVPTPTPPPSGSGSELLVFDWNKPVEKKHHGFPWDNPPLASANGNWRTPVNYAEGTLHFRAEIRNMPSNKNMFLQFCFWQYKNTLENCGRVQSVSFQGSNVVVTWSQGVADMWKKGGKSIDWANPRDRNGFAIKNSDKKPVSDYSNWNWNGENPDQWYPMDIRFTVVVVEKGKTFSGWNTYIR